ncbi:hypothetical protein [Pontibacillus halophilus]|uniref:hypothetical protein n=1 Tax=Pontibacillus halophilus TaxID=516704 RepID=UPI00042885B3|nr:hypothetical protein [Pontibacillus halophilus]
MKKKALGMLLMSAFILTFAVMASPFEVAASNVNAFQDAQNVQADGSLDATGLFSTMNSIVYVIIGAGAIWVIACLVFSGFKLSAAQGGNPQARTQALIGFACAFGGGIIIVKCYDIASWIWAMSGQG